MIDYSYRKEGFCIGGPLAGKQLAHDGLHYQIDIFPEMGPPSLDLTKVMADSVTITRFTYRWMEGWKFANGTKLDFWVNADGPKPDYPDIFNALCKGYSAHNATARLVKKNYGCTLEEYFR